MSILPTKARTNDKKTLTKKEIHEQNKKSQRAAGAHTNQNPGKNHEHNPLHEGVGRK